MLGPYFTSPSYPKVLVLGKTGSKPKKEDFKKIKKALPGVHSIYQPSKFQHDV